MTRAVRTLISVLLGMWLLSPALAQQTQTPTYGSHMWNSGWHGWFFGPLMMIAFVIVAVVVVVFLVRFLGGAGHGTGKYERSEKTPLDILKERYAKGEIEKEEFEERQRVLDE